MAFYGGGWMKCYPLSLSTTVFMCMGFLGVPFASKH